MKRLTELQKRLLEISLQDPKVDYYRGENLEWFNGKFSESPKINDVRDVWIGFSFLQFGDYNGTSTLERSNVRVFTERYGNRKWFLSRSGAYHHEEILISIKRFNSEDAIEDLEGLLNYPALDDEDMSTLEFELQSETWKEDTRKDFHRALVDYFENNEYPEAFIERIENIDPDDDENDRLIRLFEILREATNTYWVHEDPSSAWIDLDRILQGIGKTIEWRVWVGSTHFDPPFKLSEQGICRILFPEDFEEDPRQLSIFGRANA